MNEHCVLFDLIKDREGEPMSKHATILTVSFHVSSAIKA